ncbi:MAG TPA: DnaJ domain-containing protein [Pyrinomonadaceae bacterium]|nr:DnaJ domain-containing protein [Pyrinomonadaceae bacterium]
MNGQLSEQPLAEVIREISAKSLGGRLRLEHERVKVVAYFENGKFLYAASNVRTLRLREYLQKSKLVSEQYLARFDDRISDLELTKRLCAQNLLSAAAAEQLQTQQVSDVLRMALLWTEGTWDFDPRSRLNEQLNLKININSLLVEREEPPPTEDDVNEVENFLERVKNAQTFYDVLGVSADEPAQNLKTAYYQLARRYHPDRFRKADPAIIRRIESAFARITQAYDTLRDEGLRATYNSKLQARKKLERLAESAPKATTPQPEPTAAPTAEPVVSAAERAEVQFKEGFAALELGQRKVALSLFASAANAVPKEARYRAYYGHLLAGNESTQRAAEAELQAAIKLDPGNAEYRVMLAQLYRDLGLKLRAKGEAERAVAADPNNRKARDLLRSLK